MAIIGCLGSIPFFLSADTVRTLDNLQWSGSARYAVHQRHLDHALTEFVGIDPEKITFSMALSTELGVDPIAEIRRLRSYKNRGTAVPFTIGLTAYGSYRWTVVSYSAKMKAYDRAGNVTYATVSVTLQEYSR